MTDYKRLEDDVKELTEVVKTNTDSYLYKELTDNKNRKPLIKEISYENIPYKRQFRDLDDKEITAWMRNSHFRAAELIRAIDSFVNLQLLNESAEKLDDYPDEFIQGITVNTIHKIFSTSIHRDKDSLNKYLMKTYKYKTTIGGASPNFFTNLDKIHTNLLFLLKKVREERKEFYGEVILNDPEVMELELDNEVKKSTISRMMENYLIESFYTTLLAVVRHLNKKKETEVIYEFNPTLLKQLASGAGAFFIIGDERDKDGRVIVQGALPDKNSIMNNIIEDLMIIDRDEELREVVLRGPLYGASLLESIIVHKMNEEGSSYFNIYAKIIEEFVDNQDKTLEPVDLSEFTDLIRDLMVSIYRNSIYLDHVKPLFYSKDFINYEIYRIRSNEDVYAPFSNEIRQERINKELSEEIDIAELANPDILDQINKLNLDIIRTNNFKTVPGYDWRSNHEDIGRIDMLYPVYMVPNMKTETRVEIYLLYPYNITDKTIQPNEDDKFDYDSLEYEVSKYNVRIKSERDNIRSFWTRKKTANMVEKSRSKGELSRLYLEDKGEEKLEASSVEKLSSFKDITLSNELIKLPYRVFPRYAVYEPTREILNTYSLPNYYSVAANRPLGAIIRTLDNTFIDGFIRITKEYPITFEFDGWDIKLKPIKIKKTKKKAENKTKEDNEDKEETQNLEWK